jgi:peptidoglycan/LPS O-acetylase OafA/YrhL
MIVGLAAVSFALNVWLTPRDPSAAFYLPLTRFWELMAGSALAYHVHYGSPGRRMADAKAAAGLALVAAGIALLSAGRAFPGWWALLPVVGSSLLIAAGPAAWINRRLLFESRDGVHRAHQLSPVPLALAAARLWRASPRAASPPAVRLALLAMSFVLACLTYELIEKKDPLREAAVSSSGCRCRPSARRWPRSASSASQCCKAGCCRNRLPSRW